MDDKKAAQETQEQEPTTAKEKKEAVKVSTLAGTYGQKEAAADTALEPKIQQEQRAFKAKMQSEMTVPVLIPADPLNPGMKAVPVLVNGVRVDVPVGKLVHVPLTVANVLADSDYIAPKLTVEPFDESKMP